MLHKERFFISPGSLFRQVLVGALPLFEDGEKAVAALPHSKKFITLGYITSINGGCCEKLILIREQCGEKLIDIAGKCSSEKGFFIVRTLLPYRYVLAKKAVLIVRNLFA